MGGKMRLLSHALRSVRTISRQAVDQTAQGIAELLHDVRFGHGESEIRATRSSVRLE